MVGGPSGIRVCESGTGWLRSGVVRAMLAVSPQQQANRSGAAGDSRATILTRQASPPIHVCVGKGAGVYFEEPVGGAAPRPSRTTLLSRGARG